MLKECSMDNKERIKALLKERGILEIDLRIERLNRTMHTFSFFGTQLVNEYRRMALNQLEIVLNCASQYGQRSLIEITNKYLNDYIKSDFSSKYYNTEHPNYHDIHNVLIKWFKSRVIMFGELLKGEGNSYDKLVRACFDTRDEARTILVKEIKAATQAMRLIESNPRLLRMPFGIGAQWVIELFKKELLCSQQLLSEDLNRIYMRI